MLNCKYPSVYNNTSQRSDIWTQGYVLFARLKNHSIVFTKARKEKMAMANNVKFADWLKVGNITRINLKSVLLNMKDGQKEIQKRFLKIKELIINVIKPKYWKKCENLEKKMDIQIQKLIDKEIRKKLNVTIMSLLRLNLVIWSGLKSAINVKIIVRHMHITMIIQSLWTLFGFVANVMVKSIEYVYQRERLNLWTPKGDAIVQTTEETCRGELEAVPPPRNWSVSMQWLKVIDWLRHTAGCSFYQGQCITQDLWVQNLRSTLTPGS